ncbi:hypothetical protein MTR67_025249, partial [Solanum verrucosum]
VFPVMVSKLVERSFQRHRFCSIPSSYERVMIFESWAVGRELIFGSFCPILKEKELGFKRRRRRRRREERGDQQDLSRSLWIFVGGDPYQGM